MSAPAAVPPVTRPSILPTGSTPLERALEQSAAALLDVPTPVQDVWSPLNCPPALLPWLAWGLAIAHWRSEWSEQMKRERIADAIPYHRRKGTRAAVDEVLGRYHPDLSVTEWHQANPRRAPHTFEVRAPAAIGAEILTEATAAAIVADVAVAKPARAHFDFVQVLEAQSGLYMAAGGMAGAMWRADATATLDTSRDWSLVLQTEDGEPIRMEDGADYLETE